MALYKVLCFIKFDLINNGFGIINDDDISLHLVRVINIIQKIILRHMKKNCGRYDTNTSSKSTIEILPICMSPPEISITKTDLDILDVQTTKTVQLPHVVSDDGDCPVAVEEVCDLAGLPDPHATVTNGSVNPLLRRRRFASTWKRIKRSALSLCCCVR